jgi:hypothetical protein
LIVSDLDRVLVAPRLTDTTRRARGAPPCLVHAASSPAAFSHAWRSLGAPARAAAQSRRGIGWPTTPAAGGARAPYSRSESWNASSSAPDEDEREDEQEAAVPSLTGSPIFLRARKGGRPSEAVIESSARSDVKMGTTHVRDPPVDALDRRWTCHFICLQDAHTYHA